MNARAYSFLEGVLGKDGARAFKKAVEHENALANAVVPRAILAWVDLATQYRYEGEVPGVSNTYLTFRKAEGNAFDGALSVGDDLYTFAGASRYHVAATVAVMLGVNALDIDSRCRDITLQRLGKSIDTLVKARVALQELEKVVLDPNAGYKISHQHHQYPDGSALTHVNTHGPDGTHVGQAVFYHEPGSGNMQVSQVVVDDDHQRRGIASAMYSHAERHMGKKVVPGHIQTPEGAALWAGNAKLKQFGAGAAPQGLKAPDAGARAPAAPPAPSAPGLPAQKTELPGQANKPKAHAEPMAPQGPQFQQAQPKPPPKTGLKITKSQADSKCSMCRRPQFRAGKFTGCLCFMDMAKSVRTVAGEGFYVLQFKGAEWDADAIDALKAALRGK